jgi:hypothetical protein
MSDYPPYPPEPFEPVGDVWVRLEVDDGLRQALTRKLPRQWPRLERVGYVWVVVPAVTPAEPKAS